MLLFSSESSWRATWHPQGPIRIALVRPGTHKGPSALRWLGLAPTRAHPPHTATPCHYISGDPQPPSASEVNKRTGLGAVRNVVARGCWGMCGALVGARAHGFLFLSCSNLTSSGKQSGNRLQLGQRAAILPASGAGGGSRDATCNAW